MGRAAVPTTTESTCAAQGTMVLALTNNYTDANGALKTISTPASWPNVSPC
ncbi:hypothetical protein [Nostocoides veronense]|uniref:hypothetical protein n=1 Tax=Nostocoides veronense TaxID=330836 RepID=UPI0031E1CEB8